MEPSTDNPDPQEPQLWQAFYPNPHQMVVGRLLDGRLKDLIWVDMGPKRKLPQELPHFYTSVQLTMGHVNSMVELRDQNEDFWCFTTARNGKKGHRALTIGMYQGQWEVSKMASSPAKDIYNLVHEARSGATQA